MKVDTNITASTAQCNVILRTLLIVVSLSAFAFSADYCSRSDYGEPVYEAGISLLYGKAPVRKGTFNLDSLDHAFFLPYFAKASDFTLAQWRNHVTLPEVWSTRESFPKQRSLPQRGTLVLG